MCLCVHVCMGGGAKQYLPVGGCVCVFLNLLYLVGLPSFFFSFVFLCLVSPNIRILIKVAFNHCNLYR